MIPYARGESIGLMIIYLEDNVTDSEHRKIRNACKGVADLLCYDGISSGDPAWVAA